ncbi:Hypothetical predicted protein [Octopus vulgaris]|uniref:Uncharacterized protein n=1 Tax=Octopus vulgaris TaxID=6645 RepID=A0AA36EXZ3_OCTVU|nr:Hypothetical predicted protein [Octopus vulgaris]
MFLFSGILIGKNPTIIVLRAMDGAGSCGVSRGCGDSGDSDSVGEDTDDGSVLAIAMTIIKRERENLDVRRVKDAFV